MGREATYYGRLSQQNGNALFLPFYGVSSCAVNITRVDNANAAGEIYAQNIIPKVWDYDATIFQQDAPFALYGFPLVNQPGDPAINLFLSTASVAKEEISGAAVTLNGGNLQGSNLPVTRLQGKSFMVPPAVSAVDTTNFPISGNENAGGAWSVEGWLFRSAATAAANVYMETNVAQTNYLRILMSAAGVLSLNVNGVNLWTAGTAIPTNTWTHFAVVSNGTQIIYYQAAIAPVTTAYAHATGLAPAQTGLNMNAAGQHYSANFAVYRYAISAAIYNRHDLFVSSNDYFSGGVLNQGGTIGQGGSVQIVYANNAAPSFSNPGVGVWAMVLPLQGIGLIRAMLNPAEYVYEVHTEELDV